MIYGWRYPKSIHRSVMIGVNPPGHFLWDAKTTDEQIGRYAALCAKDETCSARTDDLAASMRRTLADMPDRWFFLPIKDSNVRIASFYGLMESTPEAAPLSGADDARRVALRRRRRRERVLVPVARRPISPSPSRSSGAQYAAVARLDAQAAADYFSSGAGKRESNLGDAATAFIWGGGRLADAWPAAPDEDEYSRVRTSNVETLLIGGALDFATPPQSATKRAPSVLCRTAARSCCPGSGTRRASGRSSRRPAPG